MKRFALALLFSTVLGAAIQTPDEYFGFRIGSDRKLARWDKIVDYLQKVAAGSDRIRFRTLGPTTNGNPYVLLEISSPDNLKQLDRLTLPPWRLAGANATNRQSSRALRRSLFGGPTRYFGRRGRSGSRSWQTRAAPVP